MTKARPKRSLAPPSGREQRKHPRVGVNARVDIASGANFYVGHTRDISLSGVFIETRASIAVGMPLTIKLDLLGKVSEIPAEVVWVMLDDEGKPEGAGARFLEVSAELRKRVEAFMVFREPMEVEVG